MSVAEREGSGLLDPRLDVVVLDGLPLDSSDGLQHGVEGRLEEVAKCGRCAVRICHPCARDDFRTLQAPGLKQRQCPFARVGRHLYAATRGTTHSSKNRNRELRAPATKIPRVIKRLGAALRGGVCVSSTRGSTVEARGAEVLHIASKSSLP